MGLLSRLLDDHFFRLLEASADEACQSVRLLAAQTGDAGFDLQAFSSIREKSRKMASKIEIGLAHNVMAGLKREDIVALSNALCLISEAVERLAERWALAQGNLGGLNFTPLMEMLGQSAETVVAMVRQLRIFVADATAKQLHAQLQQRVDAAEGLGQAMIVSLEERELVPVKLVMVKDVIDHAIAVSSVCGDCGDLVYQIVLKYG